MVLSRKKKSDSEHEESETNHKKRKKGKGVKAVLLVVVLAAIIGITYALIKTNDESPAQKATSDLRNKSEQYSSSAAAAKAKFSQSSNKSSSSSSDNKTESRPLPPSSGRINLSGTITAIDKSQVTIKTSNGDSKTFSIEEDVRVSSSDSKTKKLADIPKDSKATVSVSISPQGEFRVQYIRLY